MCFVVSFPPPAGEGGRRPDGGVQRQNAPPKLSPASGGGNNYAAFAAATALVAAVKDVGLKVPLVVRLEGTNVDLGKKIIAESKLNVTSADDLDDAAQKIVKAVKGAK